MTPGLPKVHTLPSIELRIPAVPSSQPFFEEGKDLNSHFTNEEMGAWEELENYPGPKASGILPGVPDCKKSQARLRDHTGAQMWASSKKYIKIKFKKIKEGPTK